LVEMPRTAYEKVAHRMKKDDEFVDEVLGDFY